VSGPAEVSPESCAARAAALFAVDPVGTGVALRGAPGPVREGWLAILRGLMPPEAPWRRVPLHATDARLFGGLDLAATLRAGRPVAERGLLADADGGIALVAGAERLAAGAAARLAAVLDQGSVALERDGIALRHPARLGLVALDEGMGEGEAVPAALLDRLAFRIDLGGIGPREILAPPCGPEVIAAARALLGEVELAPTAAAALCEAALALGIASIRAPLLALRVARAAAALEGRRLVCDEHLAEAGRFVLAPRATVLPALEESPPAEAPPDPAEPRPADDSQAQGSPEPEKNSLAEVVLAAAQAAIPAGLLAQLRAAEATRSRAGAPGRGGEAQRGGARGRPGGVRRGEPRAGARLNLIETLRAAAPWQPLRRAAAAPRRPDQALRVEVRRDDFRVTRFKRRAQTTTIFAVDASGSSAFQRLAEAKGAVELLLAECYVRRDCVALLAFRGRGAELLLPPTRSLVRAKRGLAGLPGGGGTPLAAGLEAALALADGVRRRGQTPVVVLLTDGRANVARDGIAARARAGEEALAAARRLRESAVTALVVDTSPKPQAEAGALAAAMGARYLPLPRAGSVALSEAVRAATAATPARGRA